MLALILSLLVSLVPGAYMYGCTRVYVPTHGREVYTVGVCVYGWYMYMGGVVNVCVSV